MKSYLIATGFLLATVTGASKVNKWFKRSHAANSNQSKASKLTIDYILLLNKSVRHMDTQALENSIQFLKSRLENIEKCEFIHDYSKRTAASIDKSILICLKAINPIQTPLAISLLEVVQFQSNNKAVAARTSGGPIQMARSTSKRRLSNSSANHQYDKFTDNVSGLIQNSNRILITW